MPFTDTAWPGGGDVPHDPAPHWDLNGLRLMLKDRHTGVSKNVFVYCANTSMHICLSICEFHRFSLCLVDPLPRQLCFFSEWILDSCMSQQFGVTCAAHGRLPTFFCLACWRKFFSPFEREHSSKVTSYFLWEPNCLFPEVVRNTKESDIPSVHTQRICCAVHLLRKPVIRRKNNNNFNQAAQSK